MSVGPRVQKFNIVINDHGRKQKCDVFFFKILNTLKSQLSMFAKTHLTNLKRRIQW